MSGWPDTVRSYLRFVGVLCLVGVGTLVLGYAPTRSLGGPEAVRAMVIGCGLSWLGSLLGGIPLAAAAERPTATQGLWFLVSMAIRMVMVLTGALIVLFAVEIDRRSLLIWVGISYLAFLAGDVGYALARGRET